MAKTTLEQWRMFKAVVDHGGFNQAAAAIHKSQSSVHHAVQKLEASLGVSLLEVVGRRTVATAAGQLMLRRADYLLSEVDKVEMLAATLGEGVESQLTLAIDEAFPRCMINAVLRDLAGQFPLLAVQQHETVLAGAYEMIKARRADVGISGVAGDFGYCEELCQLAFIAVASPSYAPLQKAGPLSLEDLKNCRQIVTRDSSATLDTDCGWLGADQRWTVGQLSTAIEMVRAGFGFTWLPLESILHLLDSGELVPLALGPYSVRHINLYLQFDDPDRLGPAAKQFIALLREQVQRLAQIDIPGTRLTGA